jgi:hypothetical protein
MLDLLDGCANFFIDETGHHWFCDRNFTGTHGQIERPGKWPRSCIELLTIGQFSAEIDFPGFVALMEPNENCPYSVISIVLRGSQGDDFQPGSGMLSAGWATNYDAAPIQVNPEAFGFRGKMHAGYVNKIYSCNTSQEELASTIRRGSLEYPLARMESLNFVYPLDQSIWNVLSRIPEKNDTGLALW